MKKEDFTRERKLSFPKLLIFMARKSVKSLQNRLNETESYLSTLLGSDIQTVTKGAYTQAREKLNYTAFIELAEDIRDSYYERYEYKRFKGFRLLGVDGSTITLPDNEKTREVFGSVKAVNQYKDKAKDIVQGRISLLYDLLNNIVVDAVIKDADTGEHTMANENHFPHLKRKDLVIFDRGYPSYEMFATIAGKYNADYLMRIKTITYKQHTQKLFDPNSRKKDIVVTLTPPTKKLKEKIESLGLPSELKVRFVQVLLPDGEVEVLATSVLDKEILKTEDFKDLYFKRWRVETFYDIIKNRLALENFTGTTPLAIQQDFYGTIFVSNLETVVSFEINNQLESEVITDNHKRRKHPQKVNKSVSFHTIKSYAFDLFFSDKDIDETLQKIYLFIKSNKLSVREGRSFKRPDSKTGKNTKGIKSANFQKRKKKAVF